MKKIAVAVLVALSTLVFGATSASAHASLTWSSPAIGSTLETAPTEVTLVFDDEIQVIEGANVIEVTNQDGAHFETGDTQVNAAKVFVALNDLADGTYTVAYHVVSADGHPVAGEYSFELNTGAALMTIDSVKRGVETEELAEPEVGVAYSSPEDGDAAEPTESPVEKEMILDSPMTTSVGEEASENSGAAIFIWLAVIAVLLGGGAFYVVKVRKSKA
jgi:methionine-rich copper-binding protein CopC